MEDDEWSVLEFFQNFERVLLREERGKRRVILDCVWMP